MDIFLQQLLNGLVLGCLYALVALGYTMVYGVLGLINFAHGEVVMVGAMVALTTVLMLMQMNPDANGWLILMASMLAAIPACMALSFCVEKLAYKPLRNAPRLAPLISAIGVSILLQTLAMLIWGRNTLVFPEVVSSTPITLFELQADADLGYTPAVLITPIQALIVVMAIGLMAGLVLMLKRTRLGKAMRATAENPDAARLMGIDPNRVISATFVIGAALAGIAGVLLAANYSVAHFYMGFLPGLKAFTAAVLGGIGNVYGAMLGGLILGMVESLGAGYLGALTGGFLGSQYQDVLAFVILILVLLVRPQGILGGPGGQRA